MTEKLRLGVLVSGRGSNLAAILDEIKAGRLAAEVALVLSDNPTAKALDIAARHGVAAESAVRKNFSDRVGFERYLAEKFIATRVHLVVLAGFMRLLSAEFLQHFPERVINIHPALLPSFPGLEAQKQALNYGVKISGCTVHYVNEIMDGGRIIAQTAVEVRPDDSEDSLSARILAEEHRLLPQVIGQLAAARRV
ncbi:MAG: phosphoribosylglycinamide formyltransferase [Candidatus Adiutrix sp.]|jgi:phosphoribosylglycinamide formyltransferase-1|nr:phosphoribosylglycinamide formyltransferase [Candidatus Adiutrix sp.]